MPIKYQKGSEWRKWDLHIHTPASFCSDYGGNTEEIWKKFFSKLENLPEEFKVIGINDYIFLDGYEKVLAYKKAGGLGNIDLILPVIELRLKEFVGHHELKRLNYHIIFADDSVVKIDQIKSQFLSGLKGKANLDSEYSSTYSWGGVITLESLREYGKHIYENTPVQNRNTDNFLEVGFNNINFEFAKIKDLLGEGSEPNTYLQNKYFKAIGKAEWEAFKWTGSPSDKKTIINESHFVFTASPSVHTSELGKQSLVSQNVNSRLLHCSDAHGFADDESVTKPKELGHCFTWIKADPTFDGLRQVLNDSDERIFIGERPPILDKVKNNRTKYIKKILIKPVDGYSGGYGKWFTNTNIEFNPELVAIIGNKGSGKSAIADIISHCAQFQNQDDFSFLSIEKFRDHSLASNFEATLKWESNVENTRNLEHANEQSSIELVKYLPQGYFERITNEIQSTIGFQKEIEKVVFTHLDKETRGGFNSFEELIEAKVKSVDRALQALKIDNETIIKKLISYERKLNPKYKKGIEDKIELKKGEIASIIKPLAVNDPNSDKQANDTQQQIVEKIQKLNENINLLEGSISRFESEKLIIQNELDELINFRSEIDFKVKDIVDFKKTNEKLFDKYQLSPATLINLEYDFIQLNKVIDDKKIRLKSLKILLGDEPPEYPRFETERLKLSKLKDQVKLEKDKLDGPQKAYQKYLNDLKEWNYRISMIEGAESIPDTLRFLENELKYLNERLDNDIQTTRHLLTESTEKIFEKKLEVVSIYKEVKTRIDSIIDTNQVLLKEYSINISATLTLEPNFNELFFRSINQNVLGTFYTHDGGNTELNKIIKGVDFEKWEDLDKFLLSIMESVHRDQRDRYKNEKRFIDEQLRDPFEFYSYLFSLSFLGYNYQLKQREKSLLQLSPGERGALLLVFYLLLDNDDKPLIIDQPEDNLDNNSVANILVPFIRYAKKKRQIIIVTHNPNLAIVSDAEQIIYVSIEKDNQNEFKFLSGSIEDRKINECIVKVLEGTMPAFNKRKQKYYI